MAHGVCGLKAGIIQERNHSMLVYGHHACDDKIDLDDDTGHWTPHVDNKDNPTMVGDGDFFVYVKREVEELKHIAAAREPASHERQLAPSSAGALVVIETGQKAPRTGVWAAVHHIDVRCWLDEGQIAPDVGDRSESWVWVDR